MTEQQKIGVQFEGKEDYVQEVFDDISPFYDKMNNIMTFGMVKNWQNFLMKKTCLKPGESALDVGTGTGEMAFELAELVGSEGSVSALDLSPDMLKTAKQKAKSLDLPCEVNFVQGNALELPYDDNTFDGATSGFALRNVTDIQRVISEMRRVVKPGKKVVCIEIAEPKFILFKLGFRFHFRKIVPFVGRFFDKGKSIQGRQPAYTWLRDSFNGFPYGEDMAKIFRAAGLQEVKYFPKCLGSVNIYEGTK
ncbi:MAG: ubiquinone/menaquinone biosynthesis methyltransferase [Bacillota bacterium]|jgi:demethylmenaquinone methyltransferase/2-methoxy-6-polyprenyl-1,4-benzoquinol methylase